MPVLLDSTAQPQACMSHVHPGSGVFMQARHQTMIEQEAVDNLISSCGGYMPLCSMPYCLMVPEAFPGATIPAAQVS